LKNGENLDKKLFVVEKVDNQNVVFLSRISSLVPNDMLRKINDLQDKYLTEMDVNNPSLYCENFFTDVIRQVLPVPNDYCLNVVSPLNAAVFHPDLLPVYEY